MVAHCPKDYLVKLEALKPQRFVVLEKQKEMDKKGAKRQAPPAPVESSKRQALATSLEQALEGPASTPARKPALSLGTPSPSTQSPLPLGANTNSSPRFFLPRFLVSSPPVSPYSLRFCCTFSVSIRCIPDDDD